MMQKLTLQGFGSHGWGDYDVSWSSQGVEWEPTSKEASGFLIPGFVDLHIHGAYGTDFMSASAEDMASLAEKLRQDGYEAFYPTTVTAAASEVTKAVSQLPSHPAIPGFHLEGPFVSTDFPGAQPPEFILDYSHQPDWHEVIHHPQLKRITLAPERPGALSLVSELFSRRVQVSMGHTAATYQEATAAIEAGVRHSTHTFNAMRGLHHREVGALGAVLCDDRVFAEVIFDGHHVTEPALNLLLKCKPLNQVVAVSDCTAAKGMAPGTILQMWGHECIVGEDSVRLASNAALAGSACTLLDCFRKLVASFGAETATRLCCINPRIAAAMTDKTKVWIHISKDLDLIETFEVIS